jgi:transaldolase
MISETISPSATERESAVARTAAELAREGFRPRYGELGGSFRSDPAWVALRALGTNLWLDTGDLEEARGLWTREYENLTTNNTLVNKVVQQGLFDAIMPQVARRLQEADPRLDESGLVYEIGFVLNCKTALRLVEALDAHVSVELHPGFADDVETSVTYGERYYAVCPERFIIKVPMTAAGFLAARSLSRRGVPVNYTLGFSARQNYLAARFSRTRYVNVFMGRLNAFVIDNDLGDGRYVGEKATLATQRHILDLRRRDPAIPRLIGASMRAAGQLYDLAGLDVFTMPTGVARDFHREMSAAPRRIESQVHRDFEITLNPGVDRRALGIDALWEVEDPVNRLSGELAEADVTGWSGERFAAAAREVGLGSLFPTWSQADLSAIEADGKIPVYRRWAGRLASGEIGLDALMSTSALYSFARDQRELDDRIRQVLVRSGVR